ncbi:MAG: hypothetical protein RR572_05615 [Raoultibacter sp.]
MHLVIISCTPRSASASNTGKIILKFKEGFDGGEHSSEIHYLANRKSWPEIRTAFYHNSDILFALPLFVECVPGIMLEFLETLEPKTDLDHSCKTKVSFLLQGGFAEASQLRCCERYLEKLPAYLGCDYNGTLIKGNMFAVSIVSEKSREKLLAPFVDMGKTFALEGRFDKDKVTVFAKPEYFSKRSIFFSSLMNPAQNWMFRQIAKSKGCKKPLDDTPLELQA